MIKFNKMFLAFSISLLLTSCNFIFNNSTSKSISNEPSITANDSKNTTSIDKSTSTLPSPSTSVSSSINKILEVTWEEEPIISSYYGEELEFSNYGKVKVSYTNGTVDYVNLTKSNLKTNRANIYSLEKQVIYAIYDEFTLKFEFTLTKRSTNSSVAFIKKLGVGWNLGNSFSSFIDGFDYKSNTGIVNELGFDVNNIEMFCEVRDQPQKFRGKITKNTIKAVYDEGFRSIRIPMSWSNHMTNGKINEQWMNRIQEVVDYIYKDYEDLYVMITLMDGARGYDLSNANRTKTMNLVHNVWEQVSETFKDYDERLVFENLNEPMYSEKIQWDMNPTDSKYSSLYKEANKNLMDYNQEFVNVVRASNSDNNKNRYLTINTYGNIPEYAYDSSINAVSKFKFPTDSATDKLLFNGHAYYPNYFCYHNLDNGYYKDVWNKNSSEDKKTLDQLFTNLENNFIKKGIGVIISEWGSIDRDVNGRDKCREDHAYYFMKNATEKNIACMVWDNGAMSGNEHSEAFGFLNKHKASGLYDNMKKLSYVTYENDTLWYHENILNQIFQGFNDGKSA